MRTRIACVALAGLLAACASLPDGPSVMALPGSHKSFDQFRADDMNCRGYAMQQIGGTTPSQRATDSTVTSAAVGTVVGAAAGAAIGGGGRGAATGAGIGLLGGTLAGSGSGEGSYYGTQRRYDAAYIQCMYAEGHRVPVSGNFVRAPESYIPPPPPGTPPAPPPR